MISVAAELADMHPQTLRMYEARGLITPKRSPKNTRLYSQRDVERLRRIQQMTAEEGLNLAGVETVLELERIEDASSERAEAESCSADAGAIDACTVPTSANRRRSGDPEHRDEREGADAARSVHGQVPGSGRRPRSGSPPSARNPEVAPGAPAGRAARAGRRARRADPAEARRRRRRDQRARAHEAIDGAADAGRRGGRGVAPLLGAGARAPGAEKEMAKLGDEYISTEHLLLALADEGLAASPTSSPTATRC